MSNELFNQVIGVLISVIGAIITYYIVPFLKAKLGQTNYTNALWWATSAVQAAEQVFKESGQGEKKKAYVLEFLQSKGLKLTTEELDALIESAVLELNKVVKA